MIAYLKKQIGQTWVTVLPTTLTDKKSSLKPGYVITEFKLNSSYEGGNKIKYTFRSCKVLPLPVTPKAPRKPDNREKCPNQLSHNMYTSGLGCGVTGKFWSVNQCQCVKNYNQDDVRNCDCYDFQWSDTEQEEVKVWGSWTCTCVPK